MKPPLSQCCWMVFFKLQHTLGLFHISEVRHFDGRLRHTKWWLWVLGSMWHETWSVCKRCVINSVMISLFIWSQWIFKFVCLILLHPVLSLHIKVTHHLEIPSLLLLYDCAPHWQKNGQITLCIVLYLTAIWILWNSYCI
jgi:uncharacterized membrane protein YhaH (DUF805 family)